MIGGNGDVNIVNDTSSMNIVSSGRFGKYSNVANKKSYLTVGRQFGLDDIYIGSAGQSGDFLSPLGVGDGVVFTRTNALFLGTLLAQPVNFCNASNTNMTLDQFGN